MIKVKKLTVKYNTRIVGYLVENEENEIAFQYDNEWIKNGFSISPFSLPLTNQIYINHKITFNGLFGVFFESLPEGFSEILIRRYLLKNNIDYNKLSMLTKLSLVQKNGLGALSYEPTQISENSEVDCNFDKIAEDFNKILENKEGNLDFDLINRLGGSSGGARPKVHIKKDNDYYIVKFACVSDPKNVGLMEYHTNELAKKCGINVNEFMLFKSNRCKGYFGAKRFDRNKGNKIHMISLSAVLETTHKIANLDYLHLFQVIKKICKEENKECYEAYKRMCFNVLFENKDDHGKNFSFLYDENLKSYKLSPCYDLTKTKDKLEHEMTINGIGCPTDKDLLDVAKILKLSLKKCKEIISDIKKVLTNDNN